MQMSLMGHRWRTLVGLCLLSHSACADGEHSSVSMSLLLPGPVADSIASIDVTVLDENGSCLGADATGGAVLTSVELEINRTNRLKVSPGLRTFFVEGRDISTAIVARGCSQETLVAKQRHTINITVYANGCDPESCDGLDNDCDGNVDEDCSCTPNETAECYSGAAETQNLGACRNGTMTCGGDGFFGACVGERVPTDEMCDEMVLDDNCDGDIDEGCECLGAESRACGSDVGACQMGVQTCADGAWGSCVGETTPVNETCNNLDDDCSGMVDENLAQVCGSDVGACQQGVETCAAGAWGECAGEIASTAEVCNDVDDDCNGSIDDSLMRVCGSNVGACQTGMETCVAGDWGVCVGEITVSMEVCNNVDDDCDNAIDNGLARVCGSDVGSCQSGTETCGAGSWSACVGEIAPAPETCNNMDDNCDGSTDESLIKPCDGGLCATGTQVCLAGAWGLCEGTTEPTVTVAAGPYMRGCHPTDTECEADESPYALVQMDVFSIDQHEVTQAAYRNCVDAAVCTVPVSDYDPSTTPCMPVRSVTWDQARTYCLWVGMDLPTEAQWEKAARGTDERIYPWGNGAPACSLAQYNACGVFPIETGSLPAGASPYGGLDMAGNVLEWVKDWYAGNYYTQVSSRNNPQGPGSGATKVFRGGGFQDPRVSPAGTLRASDRFVDVPTVAYFDLGFRCAAP